MSGFDRDRLGSGPVITPDWIRANNVVAARIPRGASTPQSRLEEAACEYESRARTALNITSAPTEVVEIREAHRDRSGESGGRFEVETFGRWTREAYGAGRAYERAIQEARFGRVVSREEMLALGDEWLKQQGTK